MNWGVHHFPSERQNPPSFFCNEVTDRFAISVCRVGIQLPTVEVRFENLSIDADVYVGSRALPTLLNFVRNTVEVVLMCFWV